MAIDYAGTHTIDEMHNELIIAALFILIAVFLLIYLAVKHYLKYITTPEALITISVFFLAGSILVAFNAETIGFNITNPFLIISAGSAISSFLFISGANIHTQLRDRAYKYLENIKQNEKLHKSSKIVMDFINANKDKNHTYHNVLQMYNSSKEGKEVIESIRILSNLYEEMAIAIKYKEVNELLLKEYYRANFISFYKQLRDMGVWEAKKIQNEMNGFYIDKVRNEVHENLYYLYKRWS